uniref:Uncharacterized protein LOC100185088 n=1 Tax=Phallusia mammillata TaxID=59560 RepID=A0A6F9DI82_9ASCI|nr:uncharacterized protein LOC100185088 [Phallusia mammillata]
MSSDDVTPHDVTIAEKLFESTEKHPVVTRGCINRSASPLTPWGDEQQIRDKKRRSSIKGSNRQKTNRAEKETRNKRKERKDEGKCGNRKSRNSTTEKEEQKRKTSSFQHHLDLGEYMREYREVRNKILATHRDCACHGSYKREDIMKAYDSLGVPKFLHRPPTNFQDLESPETDKESPSGERSDSLERDPDAEDSSDERELSSPDARQRRNNLNLTPLRKHVRLPDMSNFPVQSVSGLGVKELVRLATARGESRLTESRTGTSLSRIHYSSGERRKLPDLPAHIQEKALCRIVELTLPEGLGNDKNTSDEDEKNKTEEKSKFITNDKDKLHSVGSDQNTLESKRVTRLDKLHECNDDPLSIAIGTSRSCQSSVLSLTASPSDESPNGASSKRSNTTVREMLTASVRDLHPFDKNCAADKTDKSPHKLVTSGNSKQQVSIKTLRNLGYKPSMRKFLSHFYTPTRESPSGVIPNHSDCLVSGKTIRKLSKDDVIGDDVTTRSEPLPMPSAPICLSNPLSQESLCANRLMKRARQRQLAAEAYVSLRRVVTLEGQNRPKLAIFSKCHTVVKPQVSVRGVAL